MWRRHMRRRGRVWPRGRTVLRARFTAGYHAAPPRGTMNLFLPLLAAVALSAPPASSGPTLAREDTLHTEVPEVLVRAPRVTLDEILDRVARGEARRESLLTDQRFRVTVRLVRDAGDPRKPPALQSETVLQVWKQRPGRSRSVVLRDWRAKRGEGAKAEADLEVGPSMGEDIVNFAFHPAARRDFRYRIVGREVLPGPRLIYRIAFEPRSRLDPTTPSGLVWVDTNEFVIVRQEVSFERSPVPLFLRGVRRMVVERGRADGFWVLRRVLLRADATLPIPGLGRSFDFAIAFDDYAINRGLADSLFADTRHPRAAGEAR